MFVVQFVFSFFSSTPPLGLCWPRTASSRSSTYTPVASSYSLLSCSRSHTPMALCFPFTLSFRLFIFSSFILLVFVSSSCRVHDFINAKKGKERISSHLLELARVGNHHRLLHRAVVAAQPLDHLDHIHALQHLAEHHVAAVQPINRKGEEKDGLDK